MLIPSRDTGFNHPHPSALPPRPDYEHRRQRLKLMATGTAGAALAAWAGRMARARPSCAMIASRCAWALESRASVTTAPMVVAVRLMLMVGQHVVSPP